MNAQRTPRRQVHSAFAWDDLNTVLAVARGGSLTAAARSLGVNHSTVSRRLSALEKATGHSLFRGLPRGHAPTAAGEELIKAATRMEAEVLRLGQLLGGRRVDLAGSVRLTAPDDIADVLLVAPLARFRRLYPSVRIELVSENRLFNLGQREADIALRCTNSPPESLVGRRVARLGATIYGARSYLEAVGLTAAEELGSQSWIGWDESDANTFKTWLSRNCLSGTIVYRSSSVTNQFAAARAGLGLAVLPCYLGDSAEELVRLRPPQESLAADLWILSHPDLTAAPRIATLKEFLFTELREHEEGLAGRLM